MTPKGHFKIDWLLVFGWFSAIWPTVDSLRRGKKFSLLLFSQSQNAGPSNTTQFTFIFSYFSQVCFLFNKAFLDLVYNVPKTNFEFWIYQCLPQNETPDCYLVTKYILNYILTSLPTFLTLNDAGFFVKSFTKKKIQKVW